MSGPPIGTSLVGVVTPLSLAHGGPERHARDGLIFASLGSLPIQLFGTDEHKQRWLPRCASGEWSPAFCLSEPEAGNHPASMHTQALRDRE